MAESLGTIREGWQDMARWRRVSIVVIVCGLVLAESTTPALRAVAPELAVYTHQYDPEHLILTRNWGQQRFYYQPPRDPWGNPMIAVISTPAGFFPVRRTISSDPLVYEIDGGDGTFALLPGNRFPEGAALGVYSLGGNEQDDLALGDDVICLGEDHDPYPRWLLESLAWSRAVLYGFAAILGLVMALSSWWKCLTVSRSTLLVLEIGRALVLASIPFIVLCGAGMEMGRVGLLKPLGKLLPWLQIPVAPSLALSVFLPLFLLSLSYRMRRPREEDAGLSGVAVALRQLANDDDPDVRKSATR